MSINPVQRGPVAAVSPTHRPRSANKRLASISNTGKNMAGEVIVGAHNAPIVPTAKMHPLIPYRFLVSGRIESM